jgi:hypothetical protein
VLYVNHLMIKRRSYARTKTSVAKPDAFMAQFAGIFGNRAHQEAA